MEPTVVEEQPVEVGIGPAETEHVEIEVEPTKIEPTEIEVEPVGVVRATGAVIVR